MKDCFITTNRGREYFLYLTHSALELNGFHVDLIEKPMLDRYFEAEKISMSDIYVFSDDDIIPSTKFSIDNLIRCLEENKDYGMIGLSWKPNLSKEEMGDWCYAQEDKDLLEVDHVGGIMVIRKGCFKKEDCGDCDYPNGIGDDKVICNAIRKSGYKVGLYTGDYFHHLGQGLSTVW